MLLSSAPCIIIFLLVAAPDRAHSEERCSQEALNTAVDLVLYYIEQNFTEYFEIPDISQVIARGIVKINARDGACGGIRSLARAGDYYTDFTDEPSTNEEKPTKNKVSMTVKGEFKRLYVHYNTSEIVLAGCRSQGSLLISLHRSLFEVVARSSDRQECLIDLHVLKFHKFGPIRVRINPAEGWFCGVLMETLFNFVVTFFNGFTRKKIRENILKGLREQFPIDKGPLCVSPHFDVVFV